MMSQNPHLFRHNRRWTTPVVKYQRALCHFYDKMMQSRLLGTGFWAQICLVMDSKANTLLDVSPNENDPTEMGTLTHTADQGLDNWSTSNYVDSGVIPDDPVTRGDHGENCMFVYARQKGANNDRFLGVNDLSGGTSPHEYGIRQIGTTSVVIRNHYNIDTNIGANDGGFIGQARVSATEVVWGLDEVTGTATITLGSSADNPTSVFVGCYNFNTFPTQPLPAATEVSCWGLGGYQPVQNETEMNSLYQVIHDYMTELGTAV